MSTCFPRHAVGGCTTVHEQCDRCDATGYAYLSIDTLTSLHPQHHQLVEFYSTLEALDFDGMSPEDAGAYRADLRANFERLHHVSLQAIDSDIHTTHRELLSDILRRNRQAVVHLAPSTADDAEIVQEFKQAGYHV